VDVKQAIDVNDPSAETDTPLRGQGDVFARDQALTTAASPAATDRAATRKDAASAQPTMVFRSECMRRLYGAIEAVARREVTAVIHGESGTGKELVARQLHLLSTRSARPFVPVDCTTLHDSMMESQLFGHVKGSFTGAQQSTIGFFRSAEGGTLFLDEIGELPLDVQAKLLRVIQERAVTPLGAVKSIPIDVRVVAATHRDLEAMVRRGTFREDLFFRLNVIQLRVPPLRERVDDIVPIAEHFLARMAKLYDEPAKGLAPDAMAALQCFDWPGNVRELANAVEHASVFCTTDLIRANDLPEKVRTAAVNPTPTLDQRVVPLEVAERNHIAHALRVAEGNQAKAARMLGIQRQRLYRKIELYGLDNLTRTGGTE
jgi:DNA-binding NtrC family response regulator